MDRRVAATSQRLSIQDNMHGPTPRRQPQTRRQFQDAVAAALRDARTSAGLTRLQLARSIVDVAETETLAEQRIYKYESSRAVVPLHTAWLMAAVLHRSLDELCNPASPKAMAFRLVAQLPVRHTGRAIALLEALVDGQPE
jgi:transcriptional regulator with XRE-family HTH domain